MQLLLNSSCSDGLMSDMINEGGTTIEAGEIFFYTHFYFFTTNFSIYIRMNFDFLPTNSSMSIVPSPSTSPRSKIASICK